MEPCFPPFAVDCVGTPTVTSDLYTKCIGITFVDGTTVYFDQDHLLKIPYFRKMSTTSSPFSKADVDLILSLFYDFRHLADAVSRENLVDPNFYVHLELIISLFLQEEAVTAKAMIAEQMSSFPYVLALELMTAFLQNSNPAEPMLLFIAAAQKVVGGSLGYTEIAKYEEELAEVRTCHHYGIANTCGERNLLKNMQKAPKENLPLEDFFRKSLYIESKANQGLNEALALFKKYEAQEFCRLSDLSYDLSVAHKKLCLHLRPSKLLELATKKIPQEDSSALCQQAMAKVAFKIYEANVLLALQYQHKPVRMSRRQFLFAPLFAYYDLEPKPVSLNFDSQPILNSNVFKHSMFKTNFLYYFTYPDNATLMDLEEEIRNDLTRSAERQKATQEFSLPPPMFTDASQLPESSQKSETSLEVQELCMRVLPLFSIRRPGFDDTAAAQSLLTYWGWDKYGIGPQDLDFVRLPSHIEQAMANEDRLFVRGSVTLKNRHGNLPITKKMDFYFCMDDFKPIILHDAIEPTVESSEAFMREQWLIRKISADTDALLDFNFFDHVGLQKVKICYPR
ncbi:MAG: hypothetical protein JSR46_06545 [Verrucomicrobia bacterium]|nr:hypothetical protein [Verrucomicrobiota bacterium]